MIKRSITTLQSNVSKEQDARELQCRNCASVLLTSAELHVRLNIV